MTSSKRGRGFAGMSAQRQREIAAQGGKAAHAGGVAHQFDADSAAEAGRKGGKRVAVDREHMAEIGRRGGKARAKKAKKAEKARNKQRAQKSARKGST